MRRQADMGDYFASVEKQAAVERAKKSLLPPAVPDKPPEPVAKVEPVGLKYTSTIGRKSHQKKVVQPAPEPESTVLPDTEPDNGDMPAEAKQAVVEETVEKKEFDHVKVVDKFIERERKTKREALDRRVLVHDQILDYTLNPSDDNLDIVCITPKPALLPISLSVTVDGLDPFSYNGTNRTMRAAKNEEAEGYRPLQSLIRARDRRSISVDGIGRGDGKDILQSRQELLAQKALMGELGT